MKTLNQIKNSQDILQTETPLRLALLLTIFANSSSTGSVILGSGTIEGSFIDEVSAVSAPQTIPWEDFGSSNSDTYPAVAQGSGSNFYQWGLSQNIETWILDGAPYTPKEFSAIYSSIPDEEWNDRISVQYPISDNSFSFSGRNFTDQARGETFVAGILEYSNGVAWIGSEVPSVLLSLSSSSESAEFNQVLNVSINIVQTPNIRGEDGELIPEPSADFIYFPDFPEFGSFRVFENESTTVEILAEFNSLHLAGFGAIGDERTGFLSPAIPEPSVTMLGAMASLFLVSMRRR